MPVLVPANGDSADVETLVARLDGVILDREPLQRAATSLRRPAPSRGNAGGRDAGRDDDAADPRRDRRGIPVFAICRGLQELNVALGGSLHQRLQDLPDRMDHSTPLHPNARIRIGKAHGVRITSGSWLHRLAEST